MSDEGAKQTPEQLLEIILASSKDKQLRICTNFLVASAEGSKCFAESHVLELDNLRRHIDLLSRALVDLVNGAPVDPGILSVAKQTVDRGVSTNV